MLQKSGRLVLWEAMFILELHSAETQEYAIILCGMLFLIPLSTILPCTHGLNVSTQNIEMAVFTLQ